MYIKQINLDTDLNQLKGLADKAFSSTQDSSIEEWFSFDEMVKAIDQKRGICIKASTENGEILGMTFAQQENPINGKEGLEKWVIVLAAVDPEKSGQSIGSELLRGIEAKAKEQGAKKMFVYTNKGDARVVNFYKKNDYEAAGWIKDYQYGEGNSAVFLLKYL